MVDGNDVAGIPDVKQDAGEVLRLLHEEKHLLADIWRLGIRGSFLQISTPSTRNLPAGMKK